MKAGEKIRNLRGNVFTERGVYRPGEKVYFKGTVREYGNGRISSRPKDEVCFFEVISPKGEQVFTGDGLRISARPPGNSTRVTGPWGLTP